jgi:hypothetical protein
VPEEIIRLEITLIQERRKEIKKRGIVHVKVVIVEF